MILVCMVAGEGFHLTSGYPSGPPFFFLGAGDLSGSSFAASGACSSPAAGGVSGGCSGAASPFGSMTSMMIVSPAVVMSAST